MKQSPRCWNHSRLRETLSDLCHTEGDIFIVAVYVDDIILACAEVKQKLCKTFQMKDLGSLHHFLGVKVTQTAQQIANQCIQRKY